jgi:hypothetical protein
MKKQKHHILILRKNKAKEMTQARRGKRQPREGKISTTSEEAKRGQGNKSIGTDIRKL